MRRGTRERLEDIRLAAEDALAFCAGLDAAAFTALPVADRRTYRALKNMLTEMGEAVKLLPPELLARYPRVDWRGWAGQRDVVPHQYFSLELSRLRPTIVEELPLLLEAVTRELAAPMTFLTLTEAGAVIPRSKGKSVGRAGDVCPTSSSPPATSLKLDDHVAIGWRAGA